MTLAEFIYRITDNNEQLIEFQKMEAGYKFTVKRLTRAGKYYRVQMTITHEIIEQMSAAGFDPWSFTYKEIGNMFVEEMRKPYPYDSQQSERKLVRYVKDFIKEHQIHEEKIHQNDELLLAAPDFMDKCCEIIGYYEYED